MVISRCRTSKYENFTIVSPSRTKGHTITWRSSLRFFMSLEREKQQHNWHMVQTKVTPHHAEVRLLKCNVYITQNPVTFVIQGITTYFSWINKRENKNTRRPISGMSTGHPRNLQLPLCPRTLLIADVTRLQPFIARGYTFRENIETLVSYNVHNEGAQQDCLYI